MPKKVTVVGIGLDLSLTATGFAVVDATGALLESGTINTKPPKDSSLEARVSRITYITTIIKSLVGSYEKCVVSLEGHSHGSGMRSGPNGKQFQQRGGIDRHELYGAVCHELFKLLPYNVLHIQEIPPKSLKKLFSGNGNADKIAMGREADLRGYTALQHFMPKKKVWTYRDNEVDALALALESLKVEKS